MSNPLDPELYESAKDFIKSRRAVRRDQVGRAMGAFGDAATGMSAAEAAARWSPKRETGNPQVKADLQKDLNERLGEIAKLKAEMAKASEGDKVAIAAKEADLRAKAMDLYARLASTSGDIQKSKMAAEIAAIERDKAAMAKDLPPAEPTPQILERAGKWTFQNLAEGAELDTLTAAALAQEMAGMGPGEKSAFLDAIAMQKGIDPGTLIQSLNGLAASGDANAIALVRDYQTDKSTVQTKHAQFAQQMELQADDVQKIAKKYGVSMDPQRAKEFIDVFSGTSKSGSAELVEGDGSGGQPGSSPLDDEAARLQAQFDALENDTGDPTLADKKRAVMQSEQFQKWMAERQYSDPDLAFKALIREARPALRSERQMQRAQEHQNRKAAGLAKVPDLFAPSMPNKIASTLPTQVREKLSGADKKRKAEEEAFRESARQQGWNLPPVE